MPDPLRRRLGRLLPAGVALALTLAAPGCSGDSSSPTASPSETPTTTQTASSSAPADTWTPMTGPGGIAFDLPQKAEPRTGERAGQDGAKVRTVEYAAADGDVRLSVSVLTTPGSPAAVRSTVKAQYLPFLVVDTVRAQGASDAGVVSNRKLSGVPYQGFDSQLTFTQKNRKAVWFTRAVELPRAVVVAQAVAYVAVDEDAVDRVQASFRRLTDGLVIPS